MSGSDASAIVAKLQEASGQLTAPGALFELEKRLVNGIELRTYKNAPATLADALAEGRVHGARTFITYEDERYSYDEFFNAVDRLGHHLVHHYGIRKGERVAIAMRNYPEWMMAFIAVVSVGAIVVPLNSWGQADELEYALRDAGATLVFCDEQRATFIADRLPELNCRAIVVRGTSGLASNSIDTWESTQLGPANLPEFDISPGDLVMVMYTSGTTGNPKGAASTNLAISQTLFNFEMNAYMSAMANPGTIEKMMSSGFEPSTLLAVPLFHVSGCFAVFMLNLRGGRKTSIMYKWDPEQALEIIENEGITVFTGVPTMAMALLGSPSFGHSNTASLYSIGAGGTACPPHLKDLIYSKLPDAYPGTGYGMTETNAAGASCTGEAFRLRPNSAGTPSVIVDIKTVDDNGKTLPRGQSGELYVRSPTNVQQYWNLPEASAATFIDGWVATGDVGYIDDDGFLYIVDRIKDMVIRGGENIYPVEIEGILLGHPDVHEAAVYGVPDEHWGEELVASVHGESGLDAAELIEYVAQRVAAFKVPSVTVLSSQPLTKNATGKLVKKTIRQDYLDTR